MATLRDVWKSRGMTSVEVAAAAGIKSVSTLYKMNRKEEGVSFGTVKRVCQVLGLSLDEYDRLDECPQSDRWRQQEEQG